MPAPAPPSLAELMTVFHFTSAELALNRAGNMSAAQVSASHRDAFGLAGLLLVILGLALALTFSRLAPGARITFALLTWGTLAAILITSRSELSCALRPRVVSTEGALEIDKLPGSVTQIVTIGGFRRSYGRGETVPPILVVGQRFRVYYIDETLRLLSLEPIGAAGGSP